MVEIAFFFLMGGVIFPEVLIHLLIEITSELVFLSFEYDIWEAIAPLAKLYVLLHSDWFQIPCRLVVLVLYGKIYSYVSVDDMVKVFTRSPQRRDDL